MHAWVSLYANSAVLRTAVGFTHIAGLVLGGGCAISADRATLRAYRRIGSDRMLELDNIRACHRVVIAGLVAVVVSGALLLGADLDTYLHAWVFWTKMALVALLLANGAALRAAAARAARDDRQWRLLAYASAVSLSLWLMTTLAGAALPNVN